MERDKTGAAAAAPLFVSGLSDPVLVPGKRIADDLVPAVFVEDLVEQVSVDLHLFVFDCCFFKEIIGILNVHQAVFLAVEHQHRIGKFAYVVFEPGQAIF